MLHDPGTTARHRQRRGALPRAGSGWALKQQCNRQTVQHLLAELDRTRRILGLDRFGPTAGGTPSPARPGRPDPGQDAPWQRLVDRPDGGRGLPFGDPRASRPGPAFRFAVNTVSFASGEEDRYGGLPAMVQDIETLGAGVARHPGGMQMFVDHLLPVLPSYSGTGNSRPWMEPIQPGMLDRWTLVGTVRASKAFLALEQTVRAMAGRGSNTRLLITLFDLGAGASGPWAQGVFQAANLGVAPLSDTHIDPVGIAWDADNLGQTVYDPIQGTDVAFAGGAASGVAGMERRWALYTMDPSDAYKRVFFRELAAAVGLALHHLANRLALTEGISLPDYIEGIEICNEIEVFHTLRGKKGGTDVRSADSADAEVDSDQWGDFYYYCASALREACDWVPIWLPGITSHVESKGGAATWAQKVDFLTGLLDRLQTHVATATGVDKEYADLTDLVAGVDYHWYHFGEDSGAKRIDALPLVLLHLETRELREILRRYAPEAQLTVTETSVNVVTAACPPGKEEAGLCEEGSDLGGSAAYRPGVVDCCRGEGCPDRGPASVEDFQASSVWMRMAAAMAAGVSVAGWHTHIANPASSFRGCGLRMDFIPVELSEQAWPRKSWVAFRQLTSVLGTASRARVLAPAMLGEGVISKSASELADLFIIGDVPASDLVWVLEFAAASWPESGTPLGRSGSFWAYLAFIDPGSETAGSQPPACARITLWQDGGLHEAWVLQVPPGPRDGNLLHMGSARARHYPHSLWRGDRIRTMRAQTTTDGRRRTWQLEVAHGDWPVLLLSTRRLRLGAIDLRDEAG